MSVTSFRWLSAVALILAGVVAGCDHGFPGSGVAVEEIRDTGDFTEVRLAGVGSVDVEVGPERSVTVRVDDNLMEYVETRVDNGVLRIDSTRAIAPRAGLLVTVVTPELTSASVSGVGDLVVRGATGERLSLNVSGAGDIKASGSVKALEVAVSGVGGANLRELKAEDVTVTVSGTGGATVHASKSLNAQVSGVGDIEVYGNPAEVSQSTSGIGSIDIRKGE